MATSKSPEIIRMGATAVLAAANALLALREDEVLLTLIIYNMMQRSSTIIIQAIDEQIRLDRDDAGREPSRSAAC